MTGKTLVHIRRCLAERSFFRPAPGAGRGYHDFALRRLLRFPQGRAEPALGIPDAPDSLNPAAKGWEKPGKGRRPVARPADQARRRLFGPPQRERARR